MHPRNRYARPYNLERLAKAVPALREHLRTTPDGRVTLDFAHADAVRDLNRALLLSDYGLRFYDLPPEALVPAVPGRLDYVHAVADLLGEGGERKGARGLDIGTGASLIYPVLGAREYGWRFVGTDINEASLRAARAIVDFNPVLKGKVELRRQANPSRIFDGVLRPGERFAFTMCNPPFYESAQAAGEAAERKWRKLGRADAAGRNFGGRGAELHTPGGEARFLRTMIRESYRYREQVGWFTTLVSQRKYLKVAEGGFRQKTSSRDAKLTWGPPRRREVVTSGTGAKTRRVLAWGW